MASRAVKKVTEAQMLDDFLQHPDKPDRPVTSKHSKSRLVRQYQHTQITAETTPLNSPDLPPSRIIHIPNPALRQNRPSSANVSRMKKRRPSVHSSGAFIQAKQQLGFMSGSQVHHYVHKHKYPVVPSENPSAMLSMFQRNFSPVGGTSNNVFRRQRQQNQLLSTETQQIQSETLLRQASAFSGDDTRVDSGDMSHTHKQVPQESSKQPEFNQLCGIVTRIEDDLNEQKHQTQYLLNFVSHKSRDTSPANGNFDCVKAQVGSPANIKKQFTQKVMGEMERVISRQNQQLDLFKEEIRQLTVGAASSFSHKRVGIPDIAVDGACLEQHAKEQEETQKLSVELEKTKALLQEQKQLLTKHKTVHADLLKKTEVHDSLLKKSEEEKLKLSEQIHAQEAEKKDQIKAQKSKESKMRQEFMRKEDETRADFTEKTIKSNQGYEDRIESIENELKAAQKQVDKLMLERQRAHILEDCERVLQKTVEEYKFELGKTERQLQSRLQTEQNSKAHIQAQLTSMYENLDKHQTENAATMKKLHADIKTKDSIIKTLRIDLVTTTEDFEKLLETAKEKQAQAEVVAEQEKENNLAYKESEAQLAKEVLEAGEGEELFKVPGNNEEEIKELMQQVQEEQLKKEEILEQKTELLKELQAFQRRETEELEKADNPLREEIKVLKERVETVQEEHDALRQKLTNQILQKTEENDNLRLDVQSTRLKLMVEQDLRAKGIKLEDLSQFKEEMAFQKAMTKKLQISQMDHANQQQQIKDILKEKESNIDLLKTDLIQSKTTIETNNIHNKMMQALIARLKKQVAEYQKIHGSEINEEESQAEHIKSGDATVDPVEKSLTQSSLKKHGTIEHVDKMLPETMSMRQSQHRKATIEPTATIYSSRKSQKKQCETEPRDENPVTISQSYDEVKPEECSDSTVLEPVQRKTDPISKKSQRHGRYQQANVSCVDNGQANQKQEEPSISIDVREDVHDARDILREASQSPLRNKTPQNLTESLDELKKVFAASNMLRKSMKSIKLKSKIEKTEVEKEPTIEPKEEIIAETPLPPSPSEDLQPPPEISENPISVDSFKEDTISNAQDLASAIQNLAQYLRDQKYASLGDLFAKAAIHQKRVFAPWELEILFKNVEQAIETISKENLKEQLPYVFAEETQACQIERIEGDFLGARPIRQIDEILCGELKKYGFTNDNITLFVSSDSQSGDLSGLLEQRWATEKIQMKSGILSTDDIESKEGDVIVLFTPSVKIDSTGSLSGAVTLDEAITDTFKDQQVSLDYINQFREQNQQIAAIATETYKLAQEMTSTVIDKSLLKSNSKLALLGGITIQIEGSADFFLPLKLEIRVSDRVENHLGAFGDPNLKPGCIDYMYLTNMLSEYSDWYRDDVPRESPFEAEAGKLTGAAIESVVKANFREQDFIKIETTELKDLLETDETTTEQLINYFGGSNFSPLQFSEGVKYILKCHKAIPIPAPAIELEWLTEPEKEEMTVEQQEEVQVQEVSSKPVKITIKDITFNKETTEKPLNFKINSQIVSMVENDSKLTVEGPVTVNVESGEIIFVVSQEEGVFATCAVGIDFSALQDSQEKVEGSAVLIGEEQEEEKKQFGHINFTYSAVE